jgi:glycosyltransferase involved in cell wall biosynthesis
MNPELSIIVPVYNEEKSICMFHQKLLHVMEHSNILYEILYINDGSADNSLNLIKDLKKTHPNLPIAIINFSRNFGKESAMSAGIDKARGDAVIIIDGDLQDPPELIPAMLAKWRDGYDVVLMKRNQRLGESFLKKSTAKLFYRAFKMISSIELPGNVGDFRLMSRKAVDALKECPENVRFMKGLFAWVGFKTTTIEYERQQRFKGCSAFTYWNLWNFALDGFISFSTLPLRLPLYFGLILLLGTTIYGAAILFGILNTHNNSILIICLLILSSIQMIMLGIIGEYLSRVSIEAKKRPLYIIDDFYSIECKIEDA